MLKPLLLLAATLAGVESFLPPGAPLPARSAAGGQTGARAGLRTCALTRVRASEEKMDWWEAPRRIVEVDNGMRARGIYYWLTDNHNVDLSKVELRVSPLEGLGVFAKTEIQAGEALFNVPRSCTIYPDMVFNDRQLGSSMRKLASASGTGVETIALATFLAREKMIGSESAFRPYVECLPWDSIHPLMWTDDEVELLEGTYAYDEIVAFREQVDAASEIFEPVLNPKGWKQIFQPIDSGAQSSEEFAFMMRGAFASVLSRAYDSDIGTEKARASGLEERVMIPLLDIFNHADSAATITFDATNSASKGFKIPVSAASKVIEPGSEILSFYGAKPNWNMLTSYGFVSGNPKSQESTLTASLDKSDPLFSAKSQALAKLEMSPSEQLFDIQVTKTPSPKVMAYLRIATATSEKEISDPAKALDEISEGNERAAKDMLHTLVQERQSFIISAKIRAQTAAQNGQENFVRREVADMVCQLLDSEGAALATLSEI